MNILTLNMYHVLCECALFDCFDTLQALQSGKTCFIPFYSIKVHDIYELGSIGNFTEMNNSDGIMEAIFEY